MKVVNRLAFVVYFAKLLIISCNIIIYCENTLFIIKNMQLNLC